MDILIVLRSASEVGYPLAIVYGIITFPVAWLLLKSSLGLSIKVLLQTLKAHGVTDPGKLPAAAKIKVYSAMGAGILVPAALIVVIYIGLALVAKKQF